MKAKVERVLVTGGAGYVGAVLVPKLLLAGYEVTNLDLYLYGEVLAGAPRRERLVEVRGDIRDRDAVRRAMAGQDAVIHLACISNDPSYELDPDLGRSINHDGTLLLLEEARRARVGRFVYASSSSVYGVREEERVTEDLEPQPLTDYSKFKAICEGKCLAEASDDFVVTVLRPATVCGYSPRQRLDVIVNILTNQAVHLRRIKVLGGEQYRPNLHIEDMTDLYVRLLAEPPERVQRKVWNAGYENVTVSKLAESIRDVVGEDVALDRVPTNDPRSYRIDSERIRAELGFSPRHTIREAAEDLKRAFGDGRLPDAMTDSRYYNIKRMQEVGLR